MTDSEIFRGSDPFEILRRWLAEAREVEINDPDAMALATVDDSGMPNVRMVLLKHVSDRALVFFTNHGSVKASETRHSGTAAGVLYWKSLRRQIRFRGRVERENDAVSDAYFASRVLQSRLGAWASKQSQPLDSRATLIKRVAEAGVRHGSTPPRPPFWGGYRIIPFEFEFWADGAHRLHDRFCWQRGEREGDPWRIQRLYP